MIIVEGPDGAGKSSLIERLVEKFNLPVAPRVVSKDTEAMVDLVKWTEDNVTSGFQNRIFDRHRLISEPIYGALMRKAFQPQFDNIVWLTAMNSFLFKECRPLVIYCLPPFETVRENVHTGDDNRRVQDVIRKIYALYLARAATDIVAWNAVHHSYHQPGTDLRVYRRVKLALDRQDGTTR